MSAGELVERERALVARLRRRFEADASKNQVLDVQRVPTDVADAKDFVGLRHYMQVRDVLAVEFPRPSTACLPSEVDGKPELMRALPWPRFCGPRGEQSSLPEWAAVTLERLEEGLRLAGLVGDFEVVRQSAYGFSHFVVEVTDGELDARGNLVSDRLIGHGMRSVGNDQITPGRGSKPHPSSPDWRTDGAWERYPVRERRAVPRRQKPLWCPNEWHGDSDWPSIDLNNKAQVTAACADMAEGSLDEGAASGRQL